MTNVEGYAAFRAGDALAPHKWQSPALQPDWIEVKVTHCGVCHSDIHLLDDGLGITKYPFVPGHEIIGRVTARGQSANRFQIGDQVGIGWQSGSCGACSYCRTSNENCCLDMESTCVNQFGGYATSFSCSERFAIRIPDDMAPTTAAPLMCGGVTVYQPLRFYNITANQKVAVVGIGGLGHLAIQFLAHFGCEVTAISSSERKQEECLSLGADRFITTNELDGMKNEFDILINTTSADLDWHKYFSLLKPLGKLILIGLGGSQISIPAPSLILGQRQVCGSWIGSPAMIEEMLDFVQRHGIRVRNEVFPLSEVNEVIRKVRSKEIPFRAVLQI